MPILALHQRHTVTSQAHRAVPQIMTFPVFFRDRVITEQRAGDVAVTCVLKPPIQGAQRHEQAVSSVRRQRSHVRAWRASPSCAPKSQRGGGAVFEQLIERQNDGHRFATRFRYCVGTKIPLGMLKHEICIPDARCKQFWHRRREVRFDKFRRNRRQSNYTGECRRRPQRWLCVSIEETKPEIAPPNVARRRLLDLESICGAARGRRVACAPVENRNFG